MGQISFPSFRKLATPRSFLIKKMYLIMAEIHSKAGQGGRPNHQKSGDRKRFRKKANSVIIKPSFSFWQSWIQIVLMSGLTTGAVWEDVTLIDSNQKTELLVILSISKFSQSTHNHFLVRGRLLRTGRGCDPEAWSAVGWDGRDDWSEWVSCS
jgi:hypothetical protein